MHVFFCSFQKIDPFGYYVYRHFVLQHIQYVTTYMNHILAVPGEFNHLYTSIVYRSIYMYIYVHYVNINIIT